MDLRMAADDARRDDARRGAKADGVRAFVETLRTERDRIAVELEQLEALERSLVAQLSEPGDVGDRALVQQEVDRLQPLVARAAERIDATQRLLERATQGRVALCDRCEGPIPLERLLVMRGTSFCAECMEDVEREARRQAAEE
jgi:RNA polymerase-binding transcription factor DksA